MHLRAAPIDAAILSLVQLLQPASAAQVLREAHGTPVAKNRFLFRTADDLFVVAPRSYELITLSLRATQRDKARLLWLNKQRYS